MPELSRDSGTWPPLPSMNQNNPETHALTTRFPLEDAARLRSLARTLGVTPAAFVASLIKEAVHHVTPTPTISFGRPNAEPATPAAANFRTNARSAATIASPDGNSCPPTSNEQEHELEDIFYRDAREQARSASQPQGGETA